MRQITLVVVFTALALLTPAVSFGDQKTLSQTDLDSLRTVVFTRFVQTDSFPTNLIFLQFEDGSDPSATFMTNIAVSVPQALKASLATRSPKGGQIVHAATGRPGVLLRIYKISSPVGGRLEVTVSYDLFSLGCGSMTYVVAREGAGWKILKETPGPQG